MSSYIVIGHNSLDVVRHQATAHVRVGLGGVGAIIAQEIARQDEDADITLMTGGSRTRWLACPELFTLANRICIQVGQHMSEGCSYDCTIDGQGEIIETRRAHFPNLYLTTEAMWNVECRILDAPDAVIVCESSLALHQVKYLNTLTDKLLLVISDPSDIGRLNAYGRINVNGLSGNEAELDSLTWPLSSQWLLRTEGQKGWRLCTPSGDRHCTTGPKPPQFCDFVGAGDAAAAGLAIAMSKKMNALSASHQIWQTIRDRLNYTARLATIHTSR